MPALQTVFSTTFFESDPDTFRTANLVSTSGGVKVGLPRDFPYSGSGYDALNAATQQHYRMLGRNAPIPDAVLAGTQTVRPYVELEVTLGSAIATTKALTVSFSLGTGEDVISDSIVLTVQPSLRQWFTSMGGSTSFAAVRAKWRSVNLGLIGSFGATGSNLEMRIHRLNFGLAIDQTPLDGQLTGLWSPVANARSYKVLRNGVVVADTPSVATVVPGLGGRMEVIAVDELGNRLSTPRAAFTRVPARDTPFTTPSTMTEEFYEDA